MFKKKTLERILKRQKKGRLVLNEPVVRLMHPSEKGVICGETYSVTDKDTGDELLLKIGVPEMSERFRAQYLRLSDCGDTFPDLRMDILDNMPFFFLKKDPWLGKMVEGFVLDEKLGSGSSGSVYKAYTRGGEIRAVKAIGKKHHKQFMDNSGLYSVISKIDHPNLIHIASFGRTDQGMNYLIMDYLSGGSLLQKTGIDPLKAVDIGLSITGGLKVLHSNGIIHCDIQPGNVLFNGKRPVLTDFGLSIFQADYAEEERKKTVHYSSEYDVETRLRGPRKYTAPYVRNRETDSTATSDMYMLGVVLYELMTGKVPGRKTPDIAKVFGQQYAALDRIIDKALVNLDDRAPDEEYYRNAGELESDLLRFKKALELNVRTDRPEKRQEAGREKGSATSNGSARADNQPSVSIPVKNLEEMLSAITFEKDGKQVPRYQVKHYKGSGSFGEVYGGRDQKENRVVAFKVARERIRRAKAELKFLKEYKAASKFEHPNLLRAYDIESIKGQVVLFTEYAPSNLMAQLGKPRDQDFMIHVISQVCDALGYLHDNKIYHRNIKPTNILLFDDLVVKLSDFKDIGFSFGAMTSAGLVGTDIYKPKEGLILDLKKAKINMNNPEADIYSLGCVMYHILTGKTPFIEDLSSRFFDDEKKALKSLKNDREYLGKQLASLKELGVEDRLVQIIGRCMDPSPQKRYSSAAELKEALQNRDAGSVAAEEEYEKNLKQFQNTVYIINQQLNNKRLDPRTGIPSGEYYEDLFTTFNVFEYQHEKLAGNAEIDTIFEDQKKRLYSVVDEAYNAIIGLVNMSARWNERSEPVEFLLPEADLRKNKKIAKIFHKEIYTLIRYSAPDSVREYLMSKDPPMF